MGEGEMFSKAQKVQKLLVYWDFPAQPHLEIQI